MGGHWPGQEWGPETGGKKILGVIKKKKVILEDKGHTGKDLLSARKSGPLESQG